ncbi:MAG: c-type cytochrome domain-containing protein [Verrucomicrobiota bacterium]
MLRHFLILVSFSASVYAAEKTTFDDHAFPIFQQSCLNCHNPDKAKGGLDLSSISGVLKGSSGGKIVEPGDSASILLKSLLPGAEKPMPPEGEKLSAGQMDILRQWIAQGLLENKSSSARKSTKPKFETSLRSDPAAKPDGPPPMPVDLLLEPPVVTPRAAAVRAIAASPWAPLIAITGQHQILLHHTESLELVAILPFPEGDPASLAFTPDARYLIVGGGVPGKSGVTVTFDITTGARALQVAKEFDSVLACDIRPSFDLVATGGPSRLLKIWNTGTGELVKSIKKHTDWITALDVSTDGVLLASGDRNGGVWVWESETGSEYLTLRGHQAGITAASFRADSNILATASADGSVRFWEMNGGNEVKKIDAHTGGVTAFAFGRDGSSVTAGRDLKAKLWQADFNHARDLAQNLPALPTAVALSSDGKRAFVADAQGSIHVYQTEDAKLVGTIQNNPPTLASRLDQLAPLIVTAEKSSADAERTLAEKMAHRDRSRDELARLEKENPADAESVIPAAKAQLGAAETSIAEANAAVEKARATVVALQASAKHWSAAAINARAISTRQRATATAIALEDSQLAFTTTATEISPSAAALQAKRAEFTAFAVQLQKPGSAPEIVAEIEATLSALRIRIELGESANRAAEDQLLAQRATNEQAARDAHAAAAEARQLASDYQAAKR